MSCLVLGMNKLGLAMAADSAVSLRGSGKAYYHADKIFPLGIGAPVAIGMFGSADFLGVPWDLVIKTWTAANASRRFATLREYSTDFLGFLDAAHPLFIPEKERENVLFLVRDYWRSLLREPFDTHGTDTRLWTEEGWELLREKLRADEEYWTYGHMEHLPATFGQDVRGAFAGELTSELESLFDGVLPPDDIRLALHDLVERMYSQAWISRYSSSGLIFFGFGEEEFYPGYIHLQVGERALGKARWIERAAFTIDLERDGSIRGFAQTDTVDSFLLGVPHRMLDTLRSRIHTRTSALEAVLPEEHRHHVNPMELQAEIVDGFAEELREEFQNPMLSAVAALPTPELAVLTRTLVSLTAFRSQLAADETGTVGGDIRVGMVTKFEGFRWVEEQHD